MLVLLIIYAKRRESARFLRIQNNLQGILGKQALLTTHYGYTHYGYTYCGSMGNKQAPYSPLQPSYHPLYQSSHPLQRRTVPHSSPFTSTAPRAGGRRRHREEPQPSSIEAEVEHRHRSGTRRSLRLTH